MCRKRNNHHPYMINKTQRFKMVTLLKSLKLEPLVQLVQLAYWFFFNDFNKTTISYSWLIMYGFGYVYFYTNCIPIMIFSTISFSILLRFTDNSWFDPSVELLLNKLGNASIYSIWNMQAPNFCSEPSIKCFKTSQLEFN